MPIFFLQTITSSGMKHTSCISGHLRPSQSISSNVPQFHISRIASIHRNVTLSTCRKTNNTLPRSAYYNSEKVTRILTIKIWSTWSNSLAWLSYNFRLRTTNHQTKLKSDYEAFLRMEGWQLLALRWRGRLQRKIVAMVAMSDVSTTIIVLKIIQTLHLPPPSRLHILQK